MTFTHDLFISYAHIDNLAMAGQDGWITSLHQALELRLAQLTGVKPSIWRDPKLQGNDFFGDEIVDQFPGVAAILTILSPRYVRSEWCLRELETFLRCCQATGGPRLGNKARIFKIVKTAIPLEEHPPEIRDLLGYDFYVIEPESGRARELHPAAGPELERQYWSRLEDLAQDISELLGLIVKAAPAADEEPVAVEAPAAAAPAASPEAESREAVYLAETSFDLKNERDAVRRDLDQHGFQILPDRALPLVAPELEKAVADDLARSRMSIHLLGRNYGIVPDGATASVVELQLELALTRRQPASFARLIWIPPDLELDDERQRKLLDQVRTDDRVQAGTDILEGSFTELKGFILRRLAPEPEPKAAPSGDGSEVSHVYLICDQRDLDNVASVEDYLFDQGLEVILPVFEGEPSAVREDHLENLRLCDGVILYYGLANELWLRAKLRELQKIGGYGRKRPLTAKAIYVAEPETPRKQRFRTREASVVMGLGGFDPSLLSDFLKEVRV